jgi:hypothetical protein
MLRETMLRETMPRETMLRETMLRETMLRETMPRQLSVAILISTPAWLLYSLHIRELRHLPV